ncbi:FliH/SctL family protein [Alkaliphilus serpentinus]|uniref:FliH/SctL family protein n=1 Tax=Alkaliphilus serpentinus TaxID=1482731 RepID=UPI001FAAD514|nr:FliH/SctL family protein [Alkaliphilus serpentinus]
MFKSTNVVWGSKKELEYTDHKLDNVIKLRDDAGINLADKFDDDILQEAEPTPEEVLNDAMEEANRIIEEAKREAAMIIEEAYQDCKNIYDKAKREGYEEGFNEGLNKGYSEVDEEIKEAMEIKLHTMEEKKRMAKSLEKQLIYLVRDIAKKVIKHQLEEDHSLLLNLIEEGLEKSTFTESIIIRVSDKDFDLVNTSKNKILMMTEGIEKMEVKCDSSLEAGSVIIETLSGTIDAGLETQLQFIEKLFEELLQDE